MFSLVCVSGSVKNVARATNFRREIGRNRRRAFLLGTRIPQRMEYGKAHGRVNNAEVLCLHRIKFGELWSTNSGVYGDGLATIYAPNVRYRRKAFDS